jgi:hypothetical protein
LSVRIDVHVISVLVYGVRVVVWAGRIRVASRRSEVTVKHGALETSANATVASGLA